VLPRKTEQNPPLTFAAREGVVEASVTQKSITEPSTCVYGKGGGGGSWCHPEKQNRTLHSHLQAREVVVVAVLVIIDVDVDGFGVVDSDQQHHMIRHLTSCQYP
jgi:hypothetical protein